MAQDSERIFIECICSQTGKTWTAALEQRFQRWVYAEHYLPNEFQDLKERMRNESSRERKQELIRRLAALDSATYVPLAPPESVDLDVKMRPNEVAHHEISPFGFECPYCAETQPVTCSCCHKISCKGEVDSANRMICTGCGTMLQFGGVSTSTDQPGPPVAPLMIHGVKPSIVGHGKTLPQSDSSRLLKGKHD